MISSQKRIPELERMIKQQAKTLSGLQLESEKFEEILNQAKLGLNFKDIESEDYSEANIASKSNFSNKAEQDEKFIITSTVHRGTASGGILQKTFRNMHKSTSQHNSGFPNFNSENLYGEIPVYKQTEIDEQIIYEGRSEMIGCCRMRFFCF